MFFMKCIIILLLIAIIPFFLGVLISHKDTSGVLNTLSEKYIIGLFLCLSLFWIFCVPMALFKLPFSILVFIYSTCLIILFGISIWKCYQNNILKNIFTEWNMPNLNIYEMIYLLLFLLLLGIQLYYAMFYESTIWSYDDSEYVVRSMDTISSDHMFLTNTISGQEIEYSFKRVLNSWEIYIAYLAKVSGFHVTTIAHTIIPVLFLLVAYLVYSYIGTQFFQKIESQLIFLCVVSVIFVFGFYSPYSLSFRLLATLWQGKAVLSAIVVPFLITFLPKVYCQKKSRKIPVYILCISAAACSLTMMGAGLSIIIYIVMFTVVSIYQKKLVGIKFCFYGCSIPAIQLIVYLIMR